MTDSNNINLELDDSKNYDINSIKHLASSRINLLKEEVSDEYPVNVTSMWGDTCFALSCHIPNDRYLSFLKLMSFCVSKKGQLSYLEKPRNDYNQLKIDLDLKFRATNEEKMGNNKPMRRYNDEFLESIIVALVETLSEIIEPTNFKIYIQEKEKPKLVKKNGLIKDGIHIIVPNLVFENNYLYDIREKLIKNKDIAESLKKINNCADIEDIIDKSIISSSGWFIYGCGKPDDKSDYYKVTKAWKVRDWRIKPLSESTIHKINNDIHDSIVLFSNYNKTVNVKILDDYDNITANDSSSINYNDNDIKQIMIDIDTRVKRRQSDLKPEEIKPFLSCLKQRRVDDFHDWRRIGLALFNMDTRNFTIWDEWSKTSNKYDRSYCVKVWNEEFPKFNKYEVGLNDIKEMAVQDNLKQYNEITNINRTIFLRKWLCTHIKNYIVKK